MKIDLSQDAVEAINALRDKIAASQPAISRRYSAIVNALVLELAPSIPEQTLTALSSRLITDSGRRRELIKNVLELDHDALSRLETSVKKFGRRKSKNTDFSS